MRGGIPEFMWQDPDWVAALLYLLSEPEDEWQE